jgi:hypothetical protein
MKDEILYDDKETWDKWVKEAQELEANAIKEILTEEEIRKANNLPEDDGFDADSYLSKLQELQDENLADRTLKTLQRISKEEREAAEKNKIVKG